jgi:branched-chain amino acid transport system permease protein
VEELGITIIRGIGEGSVYALVAMSMNVIFNASGILNLAQGEFVLLGGLFALLFLPVDPGTAIWIGLGAAVAVGVAALMAFQGYVVLLPLRSSVEQHSWLVTTLATAVIVGSLVLILQGPDPIVVADPFGTFEFLGVRHPLLYVILAGLALLTYAALRLFQARTLLGLTMNALRQDLEAARAAGASVRRLQVASFAIAGLIVGATGFIGAPVLGLSQASGITFALNGFIAAVIGGLGNQLGALVAGPALGMISVLSIFTVGGEFKQAFALALLIGVLLVRPEGVFGRPAARRV